MRFKDFIIRSFVFKAIYKFKFYLDLMIHQIGWFTSKLPEIMAFVYLAEKFGFRITGNQLIIFSIFVIILLFIGGFVWYKLGLYETEQWVNLSKNPVGKIQYKRLKEIHDKIVMQK